VSARQDVELLTSGEVGERFRVDPKTVARWGSSGLLLSVRTPGGVRRYFAVEVDALLREEPREKARELAEAEHARLSQGPVR
jgi:predicted site-specific integrase-resolvase